MSLLARFIEVNQWLSKATENRLPPVFKRHIQTLYKYQVAELLNRKPLAGRGVNPLKFLKSGAVRIWRCESYRQSDWR